MLCFDRHRFASCTHTIGGAFRQNWAIRGPVGNTNASDKISVNFQQSSGDILSLTKLKRICTAYFDERTRNESEGTSIEDKRTLKLMKSSVTREDRRDQNAYITNSATNY